MGKKTASSAFREVVGEARRERAREEILAAARALVLERGLAALTMNAVATRLGVSKPAVYYYFDGRDALLATIALGALEAEAEALVAATRGAAGAIEAAAAFVVACVDHHRANLDDFRLVYTLGQLVPAQADASIRARIPAITSRPYDALEARLVAGQRAGEVAAEVCPRQTAVALHLAAVGFVCMFSLTDARGDPMRHGFDALLSALLTPLRRGLAR